MHDLVVVGAGAIGLYLARQCKDLDVLVVDKAREIGNHTCSGLYSTNLKSFLDVDKEWVENSVDYAVIHSPKGGRLELKKHGAAAFVIDRDKMERSLAKGLNVSLNTEVKGIETNGRVLLKTTKGDIEAKMVVGCDGAQSAVAKHVGTGPKEIVNGLIALTEEKCGDNFVELWFNKDVIPDGFLWKIPRGSRTEYGMLGKNAKFGIMEKFFSIKDYEKRFGFIPIGPAKKTYSKRVLLMGNAVGITKPWSGGGIIYGFTCAQIASRVIHNAIKKGDFSEKAMKEYEEEWKKRLQKSIRFGMLFRKMYKASGNDRVEFFFNMLSKTSLSRLDMDFPCMDLLG